MIVQTVPRPTTWAEYEAVKSQLVDTLGQPLVSEYCARCRCEHFTVEPHLSEVPCPDCGSTATRCLRGSGFEAAEWHQARVEAFDQLRDERDAAGVAQVAKWAEPAALVVERDTLDLWPESSERGPDA
ncbi:hypothetical protein [uncultured Microbacterium sp.]|uniref:hypothetical protein n=1 Tax=uncultured Microbacterium sp. TaxID=191216 RepID=UPI0025F54A1F|nr:hypothetical protein [uncultured Microbacterium sp.]